MAREASRCLSEASITTDCRPTRRQRGLHDAACAGGSRLNRGVMPPVPRSESGSAPLRRGSGGHNKPMQPTRRSVALMNLVRAGG
jgi:hypothetical protein